MTVTIRLEGSEHLQRELRRLSDDLREEAGKTVLATAVEMRADIVKSIQSGPASGQTYRKSNPTRTHTASAPGQPPMTDTGRLANSITFDRIGDLTATVGWNTAQAAWHRAHSSGQRWSGCGPSISARWKILFGGPRDELCRRSASR